jgi:hypothetical protein
VVFITWGISFIGLAAWSIHDERKARQTQAQEAEIKSSEGEETQDTAEKQE